MKNLILFLTLLNIGLTMDVLTNPSSVNDENEFGNLFETECYNEEIKIYEKNEFDELTFKKCKNKLILGDNCL